MEAHARGASRICRWAAAAAALLIAGAMACKPRAQEQGQVGGSRLPSQSAGNLRFGDKLPDFELATLDGESFRLHDLIDGEHYVAVIFHAPGCPCSRNCARAVGEHLTPAEYPDLRILGVASDKFWSVDWFQEDLRTQLTDGTLTFPVVIDKDQSVMRLYGAERTPTVWLADKQGRIRFYGAPENVLEPGGSDYKFLMQNALDDLRAGRDPQVPSFPPIGCPITKMD